MTAAAARLLLEELVSDVKNFFVRLFAVVKAVF